MQKRTEITVGNLKLLQKIIRKMHYAVRIKWIVSFYFVLVVMSLNLYAEGPIFHSIQAGSFLDLERAQNQFDSIAAGLKNDQELSFLRIEKIGKYYSLRLGKFDDYETAIRFLDRNMAYLKGAIVLQSSPNEERIIRRYAVASETGDMKLPEKPPAAVEPAPVLIAQSSAQPIPVTDQDALTPSNETVSDTDDPEALKDPESSSQQPPAESAGFLSTMKGRFYVSDYYSNDSDDFEFHVLTSRLNLYQHEDRDSRYYYALDARVRKKIFNGEMKENVPEWKVDEAWAGITFLNHTLHFIGGRQNIYELYNTTIDGLNVKYAFENGFGLGIFGGLAPDKQDESLNTDYKSIGGYSFLDQDKNKIYLGYENLAYKGTTDREYFSLRIYSKLHEQVRLNAVSSASINQLTESFEVENANVNLLYTYSKNLRFNIFYNYFRTIKYYESTREYLELPDVAESFFLDNNSRTRTGLRVDYKLMKGLKVYSSAAYEKRKIDGEDKLRLTGGIRKYDLYGFDLSGRYTYIDDFAASSDEFHAEISRNLFNRVDVSAYASREEKKLDTENAFTKRTLTYGSSIYWMISKHYFMTSFLERYKDEGYINISVFTQLGYKI